MEEEEDQLKNWLTQSLIHQGFLSDTNQLSFHPKHRHIQAHTSNSRILPTDKRMSKVLFLLMNDTITSTKRNPKTLFNLSNTAAPQYTMTAVSWT